MGAAALLVLALGTVALRGVAEPRVALAFTALIALGECVRITLPGDREQAPIGAAGALAYALLGPLRGVPTAHGTLQVVAVTGAGLLLAWLPGLALPHRPDRPHRRPPWADPARRHSAARRLLAVGFAAAVFQPLYNGGLVDRFSPEGPAYGAFLTAVAALAALCDATLAALLRCDWAGRPDAGPPDPDGGPRFPAALEDELRSLFGIGSAIVATGMLVSLAAGEVGLWALPLFCTPLLLAQVSFRRAAAVRATTGQTIASLARATEVAGYTPHGHARRVADTACALGRELGLGTRELALLEYAALMHDVGQLSLVEPVPDGATALLPCAEQQRIARLGSEGISRTGVPRQVAEQSPGWPPLPRAGRRRRPGAARGPDHPGRQRPRRPAHGRPRPGRRRGRGAAAGAGGAAAGPRPGLRRPSGGRPGQGRRTGPGLSSRGLGGGACRARLRAFGRAGRPRPRAPGRCRAVPVWPSGGAGTRLRDARG